MSSICVDIPTFEINENELSNMISFIYKHCEVLKEFGGIKLKVGKECKLALIKRRKNSVLCSSIKQIIKKSKDEGIYLIEKIDNIDESIQENLLKIDKFNFWSSLSCLNNEKRQLNICRLFNKSFFSRKRSRLYFDIHRLPTQSLLKLGGSKITRQFVPCMKRSYKSGGIFPLSCVQHHLFSIDYHHEGSDHHWYIIPNSQRDSLQKLINKTNSLICLDHEQLLIDPFILNKNNIRYHKIIQHQNEFIVLSAGTLTQSFTEDGTWNESISFALPSWIEEDHANTYHLSCQCNIHQDYLLNKIDLNLFRHELIQRYIITQLNQKSFNLKDIITIPTQNNIQNISSNVYIPFLTPHQSIDSSFQSPSSSSITQSVNNYLLEEDENISDDNNIQFQHQLLKKGNFCNASNWKTSAITLIDSISNDHLSESNTQTTQLYQNTLASTNIHQNVTNNCNLDNCFLSFEEIMDILPSTEINAASTYRQDDENIDTSASSTISLNTNTTTLNKRSHDTEHHTLNQTINNRKTLFVSGLRSDVTSSNIRSHFTGCRKVTIKQYRTTPYLKYAFILCQDEQQAANMIKHADQYQIKGQPLAISVYRNGKSSYSITSDPSVD